MEDWSFAGKWFVAGVDMFIKKRIICASVR
jgi:hypothetical protein